MQGALLRIQSESFKKCMLAWIYSPYLTDSTVAHHGHLI